MNTQALAEILESDTLLKKALHLRHHFDRFTAQACFRRNSNQAVSGSAAVPLPTPARETPLI